MRFLPAAALVLLLLTPLRDALGQAHTPTTSSELFIQGCRLHDRLQALAGWVRNLFILGSVFILIFIGVQAYSGRLNWKHLAILGGSVAILALSHLVPRFFFNALCQTGTHATSIILR